MRKFLETLAQNFCLNIFVSGFLFLQSLYVKKRLEVIMPVYQKVYWHLFYGTQNLWELNLSAMNQRQLEKRILKIIVHLALEEFKG